MRYHFVHLEDYFALTTWDRDIDGAFGLLPALDWTAFQAEIKRLNEACPPGESVMVIYTARHGQAEHNVLADIYNMPEEVVSFHVAISRVVERHLSNDLSDCPPDLFCPISCPPPSSFHLRDFLQTLLRQVQKKRGILDPHLTPLGEAQASTLSRALRREVEKGMPRPERYFVSPLRRVGETATLEWSFLFPDSGLPAAVVENIREHLHVHLCDARLPKRDLKNQFPSFTYPEAMDDEDVVWKSGDVRGRETEDELVERTGKGLNEVIEMSGDAVCVFNLVELET
ncbi:hypothetical protein P7C73_g4318, partial [Tremellales sp. Uapishka_1]